MPGPHPIPAALRTGPFRLATARELGVPPHVLRGKRFRHLFRGVYVAAERGSTDDLLLSASRLILPADAVFSHHTAARLDKLPVPDHSELHVTIPTGTTRPPRVSGIVAHEGDLVDAVADVPGHPRTTALRTFLDLGRILDLVDLTVLGDAMCRRRLVSLRQLCAATASARGMNARRLRAAAALVRERVDSPMETRTRLLLIHGGLPSPETGWRILGPDGEWITVVDLCYPRLRIVIEYDDDIHRTNPRRWRRDQTTRELLRSLGWEVIVLTYEDIDRYPERTLERVRAAVRRRCS